MAVVEPAGPCDQHGRAGRPERKREDEALGRSRCAVQGEEERREPQGRERERQHVRKEERVPLAIGKAGDRGMDERVRGREHASFCQQSNALPIAAPADADSTRSMRSLAAGP